MRLEVRLDVLQDLTGPNSISRASYVDGKMSEGPKPCAGNDGTTITVSELSLQSRTRNLSCNRLRIYFIILPLELQPYEVCLTNMPVFWMS